MKKFLENLIKNHPRLASALYAYKHSKDENYIRKVLQTDPCVMQFESGGSLNPDKNIYYIEIGDASDGFFAEHGKLQKFLVFADRFGLTPVVRYTEKYIYSENEPVNGSENPFEYFYLQPAGISVKDALKSRNILRAEYINTQIDDILSKKNHDYAVSDEYIDMLARVEKKYIRLNDTVQNYISEEISKIGIDDKTLAVHYRGTDYRQEFNNHPLYVGADEYIEKASKLLKDGKYEKIFLATDDMKAAEKFSERFGDKLVCYNDVIRSTGDVSVAFSKNERKLHHYKLALEVLRDMYSLSACGGLVAGVSQVSLAARINKKSRDEKYKDLDIIYKGTASNSKECFGFYGK
ncbi:MAG: hypothetical protein K5894_09080 [Lachnospiraceae bacterium]|nr:hypothetical protein [Lachnospiraceae bacterium]MDN4743989.1 hypothetical protein [Lachnospiraceae bacterium C1.1]